jgi:hypothetical protein
MEDLVGDEAAANFPWSPSGSGATQQFFTNLYGDMWTARYYILAFGFGVSLLVSVIYMFLLRIPCLLTSVVWGSIVMVITLFSLAGYYAYSTAAGMFMIVPMIVLVDVDL